MKRRGSYPRDISIIAVIFILAILFLACINLYVSIQLRAEYMTNDRNKTISIAVLCVDYMQRMQSDSEIHDFIKTIVRSFNIERLIIADTLGNKVYDSWTLPVTLGIEPIDYTKNFKRMPQPNELIQNRNHALYYNDEPPYYVYLSLSSTYSMIDPVFKWHITYITISLIFMSFLGIFLIRNLFLPMRYVANVAQEFGIEMKKEDFVSETFREVFDKIKSKEKALIEFSAYIAHEFRNSLATITGLSRLVEKGKRKSEDIIKECKSMENLITIILEYSRPVEPLLSPVNVAQLINDSISKAMVPARIKIEKDVKDNYRINGDYDLLLIVFSNLIKNSVEAIEQQGMIRISAHDEDDFVIISVEDTGCGVEKADLDRIFSPFYSKKESGIGLGLAYVKKIVELHEGKIAVNAEKDKGTEFLLKFPELEQSGKY